MTYPITDVYPAIVGHDNTATSASLDADTTEKMGEDSPQNKIKTKQILLAIGIIGALAVFFGS